MNILAIGQEDGMLCLINSESGSKYVTNKSYEMIWCHAVSLPKCTPSFLEEGPICFSMEILLNMLSTSTSLSLSRTYFHTVSFPFSRTIFLIFVILCLDTPSPSFHPLTIDFLPSLICFKNPPYFPFLFFPFPDFPFLFFTFPFPYFPFLFPFLSPPIYFPFPFLLFT